MKRRLGYAGEGHGLEKPPLQVSPADWVEILVLSTKTLDRENWA